MWLLDFVFLLLLLVLFFLFCCLFHPHEQKISLCSLRACCVLLFFILPFSDFYLLGLNHLVVSLSISSLLETGEPPCTKTGFPLGCPFLGSLLCPVYALHLFFSDFASPTVSELVDILIHCTLCRTRYENGIYRLLGKNYFKFLHCFKSKDK